MKNEKIKEKLNDLVDELKGLDKSFEITITEIEDDEETEQDAVQENDQEEEPLMTDVLLEIEKYEEDLRKAGYKDIDFKIITSEVSVPLIGLIDIILSETQASKDLLGVLGQERIDTTRNLFFESLERILNIPLRIQKSDYEVKFVRR